jgi:hypothetical protein
MGLSTDRPNPFARAYRSGHHDTRHRSRRFGHCRSGHCRSHRFARHCAARLPRRASTGATPPSTMTPCSQQAGYADAPCREYRGSGRGIESRRSPAAPAGAASLGNKRIYGRRRGENLQTMIQGARSLKFGLPENRDYILEKQGSEIAVMFGYVDNSSACQDIAEVRAGTFKMSPDLLRRAAPPAAAHAPSQASVADA